MFYCCIIATLLSTRACCRTCRLAQVVKMSFKFGAKNVPIVITIEKHFDDFVSLLISDCKCSQVFERDQTPSHSL